MSLINARLTHPTQFKEGIPNRLIGREIEFPLAVITEVGRRDSAGLQPIRSNDCSGVAVLYDQVVAYGVESIRIATILVGRLQSFP